MSGIIVMPLFVIPKQVAVSLWHYVILGENYDMKRIRENEERQLLSSKDMEIRVSYTVTSRTFVCQTSPRHKAFVAEILGDAPNTPNERMVL